MDYTAFGLTGLCLLIGLACAVIAAHRGGTMKLNLPFLTFDGDGIALTRSVRVMFATMAFLAFGCAIVFVVRPSLTGSEGASSAEAPATESADGGGQERTDQPAPDTSAPRDGGGDAGRTGDAGETAKDSVEDAELVEAWSDCELELHNRTVIPVGGDDCPAVTGESGELEVSHQYRDGGTKAEIKVPNDAFTVIRHDGPPPTGAECRRDLEKGGERGGNVYIGEEVNGAGACILTSSGNRYLYLRFTDAVIHSAAEFTVRGTATAWDVAR